MYFYVFVIKFSLIFFIATNYKSQKYSSLYEYVYVLCINTFFANTTFNRIIQTHYFHLN